MRQRIETSLQAAQTEAHTAMDRQRSAIERIATVLAGRKTENEVSYIKADLNRRRIAAPRTARGAWISRLRAVSHGAATKMARNRLTR